MKNFFKKPVVITLSILLLIVLVYLGQMAFGIYMMMSHPRPDPTVSTAIAKPESWNKTLTAVGTLRSPSGAVIRAEAPGMLKEINFEAGAKVKKGDLLLVVDADAEKAAAKLAEVTYLRAKELRAGGVNSQADLDQAEAAYYQAKAALDKKEIRAPFDGVVGISQAYLGQYVNVGTSLIAVEDLSSMNLDFAVSQREAGLVKVGSAVRLTVDAYPGEIFEGVIKGVDPRVDDQTRTLAVRAEFSNADGRLLSGMFGTVEVVLDEKIEAMVLPSTAIVYSAYGSFVYKVEQGEHPKTKKPATIVKQIFVKTGSKVGDFVAVLEGLKDGDEVVSVGQMKLRNGSAIQIDNTQVPAASLVPTPSES